MSTVDPKVNAQDRADYKRAMEDQKTMTKMILEDRAIQSPYLLDKKKLKDNPPQQIDKIINASKNNFPMDKAMKMKHLRDESYPPQKLTKQKAKSGKGNRIQVTPGKWTSVNTVSVD